MNMITKLATKMLAVLSVVAMIASPAAAQGLSASDMAFAFGGQAAAPAAVQQTARAATPTAAEPVTIASARGMTQTEMQETDGAAVHVYYLMVGARIAYVGITNNLRRRATQHARDPRMVGTRMEPVRNATYNTRNAARVHEQNLINQRNLINSGLNRRNSISPSNPLSRQVSQPYRIR